MPYSPTTWVEGVTKLGPTRMNAIEQGIAAAIPKDLGTTKGDLITYTASATPTRRGVGADNTALVADSAQADGVKWLDLTTLLVALATFDAKGDLLAGTADNAYAKLTVGSNGQIMVPDTAQATGLKWANGFGEVIYDSGHLGGVQASIDATGLNQNYRGLYGQAYLRGDTAAASTTVLMRFNGDSAANYDRELAVNTAGATWAASESFGQTSIQVVEAMPANTAGANLFGLLEFYIPFYTHASNNKVMHAEQITKIGVATGNVRTGQVSGHWRSNAAINQITLLPGAGNFQAASRLVIWGY